MTDRFAEHLHYILARSVIETGDAPNLASLAALAGRSEKETEGGLRELQEMHGVNLIPNSTNVWILHPISLVPTAFWVTSDERGWWANCAWCALGIAAALNRDVTITTSDAEGKALEFKVEDGRCSRSDLMLHFPYSPARWRVNPYLSCGKILFFSTEAAIEGWCKHYGHPKGSILDIETSIKLANLWYGGFASPNWRQKSASNANAMFEQLGLDLSFWRVENSR
jgi:hypothetical protein